MGRITTMKPVFLSASEPNPERRPEYWESRNLLNLREAIRALVAYVLPRQPLVFGGHPAITPLVRAIADRIRHDRTERQQEPQILLFLSEHFKSRFPQDVEAFRDTEFTPVVDVTGSR